MTVATVFYDWPRERTDSSAPDWNACSPNLVLLGDELERRWGGTSLGCHHDRDVRAGATPSTHSWGAARDWGWGIDAHGGPGRDVLLAEVIPWLIANSAELGIQAIHDYVGGRIWRPPGTSGRPKGSNGWRASTSTSGGMNQPWAQWVHIETPLSRWADDTPIDQRLAPPTPPDEEDDMPRYWRDERYHDIFQVSPSVAPVPSLPADAVVEVGRHHRTLRSLARMCQFTTVSRRADGSPEDWAPVAVDDLPDDPS